MPLMTRCCCFDNTRSGTLAAGIYTLIYSLIACGYAAYQFVVVRKVIDDGSVPVDDNVYKILLITYIVEFVIVGLLILSSILLLVGVSQNVRGLLVPYMVAMIIYMLQGLAGVIILIAGGLMNGIYIGAICVWIAFTILHIFCVLCAISEFQAMRDGSSGQSGTSMSNVPYGNFK
ncbi:uncharacterized protein [Diadema antillarum]|uniref:uncharacterized protein n=1 Tax=Diadema antillarum TaxID=105358 RepID=UPI003A8AFE25